jgi:hypothetical protein
MSRYQGPEYRPQPALLARHVGALIVLLQPYTFWGGAWRELFGRSANPLERGLFALAPPL